MVEYGSSRHILNLRHALGLLQILVDIVLALPLPLGARVRAERVQRACPPLQVLTLSVMHQLAIRTKRWVVGLDWHDAVDAVFVLDGGADPVAVLSPTEPSLFIDRDKVVEPLLARQVAHLLLLEPFARDCRVLEVLAIPIVQPVVEVLVRVFLLPVVVVCAQIAAIAVLLIHHLEEVLQVHHLSRLLTLSSRLAPPPLLVGVAL